MHITIATFIPYNKEVQQFWQDETKPSVEQIELRILDICKTAIIIDIEIFTCNESENYQYDAKGKFICSIKGK